MGPLEEAGVTVLVAADSDVSLGLASPSKEAPRMRPDEEREKISVSGTLTATVTGEEGALAG